MHDTNRNSETRRLRSRRRLGALFLGAAVLVVGVLLVVPEHSFPEPLWLWLMFGVAFAYFEWNAVEINDRLLASTTVMVIMTAAVSFGRDGAVLGATLVAALGPLTPTDIRLRRVFQPVVNTGQFVLSAAGATLALWMLLPGEVTAANLWRLALASAVAAVIYGVLNYQFVLLIVRRVWGRREVRPWSKLGTMIPQLIGMGFLGGLLGAAYVLVGLVILPLMLVVFFVSHMTFSSYSQLREAQESTLRGFIKALEAKDLYTRGHTERVAYFSKLIGEEMGFNGTQLERLRWAALIHDVGKLAVPRDLIRKRARLTSEEYEQMQQHVHLVEDLLSEVEFLQPMVEIAASHHIHYDGSGYSPHQQQEAEGPDMESCILAVADSFDAMTSTRSYRVALTQEYAMEELRKNAGGQFHPDAVDALTQALGRRGERYGSPDVASEREARRLAEEAQTRG